MKALGVLLLSGALLSGCVAVPYDPYAGYPPATVVSSNYAYGAPAYVVPAPGYPPAIYATPPVYVAPPVYVPPVSFGFNLNYRNWSGHHGGGRGGWGAGAHFRHR
jgi:hypothetical protein